MHIVSVSTLLKFAQQPAYKDALEALMAWSDIVARTKWYSPADVKAQFRNASIIANNRIVFNIKGNDYRLVVAVSYKIGAVYIKFIGTHAQYDKIDAATVEYVRNKEKPC